MKRRFEEILEECLSAQLEGRRSVEESLSLYPSMALDLEPLLRTAAGVSYAFEGLNPPPHLLDRGRFRFIAASSERRRAREIARGIWGFDRTRIAWNFRHWGMLGSGTAVAIGILLVGAALLIASSGGDGGPSSVGNGEPTPTSVERAQFAANLEEFEAELNRVKLRALQGILVAEDLENLREATSQLAGAGQPPDDESRRAAEEALNEQYAFVANLADEVPLEQIPQVQDILSTTQKAANDLGVSIYTPQPTPPPSEQPTATPIETPAPTDTPEPTPPASETPAPTEAPTPTPTPPLQGVE